MKVPGFLKNKYVCYALMALAALNIIGYVTVKAWECLALFALTGYSVHSYCGDKSLAILPALFVANFVFGCGRVKEGFEDAFKGPVEHLQDAANSAAVAEGLCNDPTIMANPAEAEAKCKAAKNANDEACNYVAGTCSDAAHKDQAACEAAICATTEDPDANCAWTASPPTCS